MVPNNITQPVLDISYYRPHPKDGEGDIFSLFVSSHLGRGRGVPRPGQDSGVPHPGQDGGGYPIQVRMGGYPSHVRMGGGYSSQVRIGVPQLRKGYPHTKMGYPLPGQDGGCTPARDGVPPPPPIQRWGPPKIGQQMEYVIRSGRYASCVHAGGLSCVMHFVFSRILSTIPGSFLRFVLNLRCMWLM